MRCTLVRNVRNHDITTIVHACPFNRAFQMGLSHARNTAPLYMRYLSKRSSYGALWKDVRYSSERHLRHTLYFYNIVGGRKNNNNDHGVDSSSDSILLTLPPKWAERHMLLIVRRGGSAPTISQQHLYLHYRCKKNDYRTP